MFSASYRRALIVIDQSVRPPPLSPGPPLSRRASGSVVAEGASDVQSFVRAQDAADHPGFLHIDVSDEQGSRNRADALRLILGRPD